MRILLDTHIFLWFISGDTKLPRVVQDTVRDRANQVFLSPVSIWEAIVKHALGRLSLPEPPQKYLPLQRGMHSVDTLPLDENSVCRLSLLPPLHRDPFDRLLIAQAQIEDLTIVTSDPAFDAYDVRLLDARS